MSLMEKEIYEFGSYLLDPTERTLSCQGTPVSLTPKAFDTLLCLVRRPGHTITKDELLKEIWPGVFVEEVNLAVNISTIRKALGESPQDCRFIATVPGRGYRFVAEVRKIANEGKNGANAIAESDPKPVEMAPAAARLAGGNRSNDEQKSPGGIRRLLNSLAGRVSAAKIAVVAGLLLLIALPIGAHLRRSQNHKVSASAARPSIAVLPFADLSPAKDQEYFSDGLAEELIADLAKVPGLKVAARSSAFQFKGRNEDVRTIGKKLGVANLLEGSVQRQGDRVRIRVGLTKADEGIELWSETYDRKLVEIFSVEDEIARAATNALQVKLLGGTTDSAGFRGTNQEAYEAYLEGQFFFGRGDSKENLDKALAYATKAINLDPHYAPAWALRSRVWNFMADFSVTDMAQGYGRARADAERAIVLDPTLAAGYLALGWTQMNPDWDWGGAEASLAKATSLEPGNADVLYCRSLLYELEGRLAEAIEAQKQAISLDPLRARSYSLLGYQLYFSGKYDDADAALEKALELNPQKEQDHITRGELLLAKGQAQRALTEIEQEPDKDWRSFGEALAYHALGRTRDSDSALRKLIFAGEKSWACQIAQIYAYRGERDKAFEWLDRAYQYHDGGLPYIKVDFILRSLDQDPRYMNLLKKMRLPT
jgi:TolB-like protein/DNA-binding winged helix-turn-helix (wHTH) protein/Flp pilus assembly protein TadD